MGVARACASVDPEQLRPSRRFGGIDGSRSTRRDGPRSLRVFEAQFTVEGYAKANGQEDLERGSRW